MIIGIFGSIGVGKTTLSKHISKKYNLKLIEENVSTNPYIKEYYSDPKKYAILFQLYFLINRYNNFIENKITNNFILDRTFYEDKVFADVNHEMGNINDTDYENLYKSYYNLMKEKIIKPDIIIYLYSPVNILKERIKKRGRDFEKEISEKYLSDLEKAYENLFEELKKSNINIVKIDWSDFDLNKIEKLIEE
jgi:deoxyadenosine/deoxycytidine kinase